jgi:hypothetical protein
MELCMQSPTRADHDHASNLYLRAREPANAQRVLEELLADGIPRQRMRAHAAVGRKLPELPVAPVRWRSGGRAALEGAGYGIVVGIVLAAAVALLGDTGAGGITLILLGAAAGAVWMLVRNNAVNRDVAPQAMSLRRGEVIIVLQLDDADMSQVEARIQQRHPELMILGADPAGTPPFP